MTRVGGETGIALLEVLVTSVVVGVAVIGLALMFSMGNTFVVAHGDDRVGLGLAQQKLECLRQKGFAGVVPGNATMVPAYNEPPYESSQATPPAPDPRCSPPLDSPAGSRNVTRQTCVQYVSNTDFNSPAYTADCPVGAVTNTMRMTVTVTPDLVQADSVRVQAWLQ